jgi:enamine deaminase RidA (YjgF/YER057c/UK114 family)
MLEIEGYAAPSEDDPSSYAQVTKVTGAQTILFIAGQVAYDDIGGPAHGWDFAAQARAGFRLLQAQAQAQVEAGGGTLSPTSGTRAAGSSGRSRRAPPRSPSARSASRNG